MSNPKRLSATASMSPKSQLKLELKTLSGLCGKHFVQDDTEDGVIYEATVLKVKLFGSWKATMCWYESLHLR